MASKTATQMAIDLKAGRVDPVALAEDAFARANAHGDAALFIEMFKDRAMTEANASRLRWQAGFPLSPLDGVPIAWKDLFDFKGRVTTAGSSVLKSAPPAETDAPIVTTAARAGMTSIGSVNMTEFAYSGIGLNPHYGTPGNIHATDDAACSPGGSSSGSGVVVAAEIVPLSMGSDTGGSVRIPASFNGVVGYKTSTGHYPMQGVFPLSRSFDTIGPLARTVEDCVLFDNVMHGHNTPDVVAASIDELIFAIPSEVIFDGAEPDVVTNFEAAIARLEAAGARVKHISLPVLQDILNLMEKHGSVVGAEALALHKDRLISPDLNHMDARVVRRILQAESMNASDLVIVQEARARMIAETTTILGNSILLCPTTPTVAMEIAPLESDQDLFFRHNSLTLRNTSLGNFLDWAGVSIPNGTDRNGMPTGFLLSVPHGRDHAVLAAALATEEIIRG